MRIYVMDQPKRWEYLLALVDFSYNNNYQSTINMVSFEFLYRKPCQMPLSWDRIEDRVLVGPEVIQEMEEKMQTIRQRIKEAQDQQKSYVDAHCVDRSYDVVIEYFDGGIYIRVRSSLERVINYLLGSWDPSRLWRERGLWPID